MVPTVTVNGFRQSLHFSKPGRVDLPCSRVTCEPPQCAQSGPFGQRITSTHNGVTTKYVIDPIGLGDVAAEYDSTGNLIPHGL